MWRSTWFLTLLIIVLILFATSELIAQMDKSPIYQAKTEGVTLTSQTKPKSISAIITPDSKELTPFPSVGWMPIGLYCVSLTPTISQIAGTAFNIIHSYSLTWQPIEQVKAYFDEAERYGFRVSFNPSGEFTEKNTPGSKEIAFNRIRTLKNHPALGAWYIADEPECNNIPPTRLEEIHNFASKETPNVPSWIIMLYVERTDYTMNYWQWADVKGIEPYLYSSPIYMIRHTSLEAQHVYPEKPIWTVVEAHVPNDSVPFPSPAKIRAMTYDALIQGATGIYFFAYDCLSGAKNRLSTNPEAWEEVKKLAVELKQWTPWILNAPVVVYSPGGDLHYIVRRQGNDYLVFIVNAYPGPLIAQYKFNWTSMPDRIIDYRTGKEVLLTNSSVLDTIPQWGSRIYQFRR